MSPPAIDTAAASRGGSARTEAKAAALERLHASRRGVRVHSMEPRLGKLLARAAAARGPWLRQLSRSPGCSLQSLADACGVERSSARRWLLGVDVPAPEHHARIEPWCLTVIERCRALERAARAPVSTPTARAPFAGRRARNPSSP